MRLGRGKLVFRRKSLVFLLRAGESRLSEKERSGFELGPVIQVYFLTKPSFARREYGESHTHEQGAKRIANASGQNSLQIPLLVL